MAKVSFLETMRGCLVDQAAAWHPVRFEVRAVAPLAIGLTTTASLLGVIHAAPWAREAPVKGTLRLSPRELEYRLTFLGADGTSYDLLGRKRPSVRRLLASMTRMECELRTRVGTLVAEGEFRFDLFELPGFAASWLLAGEGERLLDARRRTLERQLLDRGVTP